MGQGRQRSATTPGVPAANFTVQILWIGQLILWIGQSCGYPRPSQLATADRNICIRSSSVMSVDVICTAPDIQLCTTTAPGHSRTCHSGLQISTASRSVAMQCRPVGRAREEGRQVDHIAGHRSSHAIATKHCCVGTDDTNLPHAGGPTIQQGTCVRACGGV